MRPGARQIWGDPMHQVQFQSLEISLAHGPCGSEQPVASRILPPLRTSQAGVCELNLESRSEVCRMAIIGDWRFIASKVAYRCVWPPEWHSGGQGFEPPRLHHPPNTDKQRVFLMCPPKYHHPKKTRFATPLPLLWPSLDCLPICGRCT